MRMAAPPGAMMSRMSTIDTSGLGPLTEQVRRLLKPGWNDEFHRLSETLAFLRPPRRPTDSRFLDLPPVYFVGAIDRLISGQFVLFTGLNPNGADEHRGRLAVPFDEYWAWCLSYFRGPDRSKHYDLHEAFLRGLFDEDSAPTSLLSQTAVDVDLCGLASSNGWPEEQVRLLRADRPRLPRPQLHQMRKDGRFPTFRLSAAVFELLAPNSMCVVARYDGTRKALRELYPSDDKTLKVAGREIPFFCIPNDGRNPPSTGSVERLGRAARLALNDRVKWKLGGHS